MINVDKLMAREPTLIGVANSIAFFEHPTLGDEAPLIAVYHVKGKRVAEHTDCYEMSDAAEWAAEAVHDNRVR